MLILAGVSISALMGNEGLFARADNTVKQYGDAAKTEAAVINELLQSLDDINKKHYIYDKEDLEEFIDNVSAGNSYKDEEVILMDNIDLKGNKKDEATWWKPIEAFDSSGIKTPFEGIFDGNNHSITGLYAEMYEGKETLSIFNHINNAEIKKYVVY